MTWYERIIAAHAAVTGSVSHAVRLKSERYFVWMEDSRNDFEAGNRHAEKVVEGTTDLYTKQEFARGRLTGPPTSPGSNAAAISNYPPVFFIKCGCGLDRASG